MNAKSNKNNEKNQVLKGAEELFHQGKWRESLDKYRDVIANDPTNSQAHSGIINLYLKKGEFSKLIDEYMEWAKIESGQNRIDEALGIYQDLFNLENTIEKKSFLVGQKSGSEGLQQIKEQVNAVRPAALIAMGELFLRKGKLDEAIQHLEPGVEADPSNPEGRLALGKAYLKKGMDREAIGEFQEVVRLSPEEAAFAYEMLGDIFFRGGKPPHTVLVWFKNAAQLYQKNQKFQDAIKIHEKILTIQPEQKESLSHMADIYVELNETVKAAEIYEKLIALYQKEGHLDTVNALFEKILNLQPENKEVRQKVLDFYRQVLQKDHHNLNARNKVIGHLLKLGEAQEVIQEFLLLAGAYIDKGMLEEGEQVCRKLLEMEPDNIACHEILAQAQLKRNNLELALQEYFKIIELFKQNDQKEQIHEYLLKLVALFPDIASLNYQIALSFIERQEYELALNALDQVLQKDPKNVDALKTKAQLLANKSDISEASEIISQLLTIEPENIELRENLLEQKLLAGSMQESKELVSNICDYYVNHGNYETALNACKKVLSYIPEDRDIRGKIGDLYLAKGDSTAAKYQLMFLANLYQKDELWDNSHKIWEKIVKIIPQDFNANYRLSKIQAKLGLISESIDKLNSLAESYTQKNLKNQAVNILNEIINYTPNNSSYRKRLIELLLQQDKAEEATVHYKFLLRNYLENHMLEEGQKIVKELINLHPFDLDLREDLTMIYTEYGYYLPAQELLNELSANYLQQGELEKAVELLNKVSDLFLRQEDFNSYWEAKEKIVNMFITGGWFSRAVSEAKKVIIGEIKDCLFHRVGSLIKKLIDVNIRENKPEHTIEILADIAGELEAQEQLEGQLYVKEQLVELLEKSTDQKKTAEVYLGLADTYASLERYKDSLRTRSKALEYFTQLGDDEMAMAQYLPLIELYLKENHQDEAFEFFYKANKKLTGIGLNLQMAELLYKNDYTKEAIEMFNQVLIDEPQNATALGYLSLVYFGKGQFNKALDFLKQAIGRGDTQNLFKQILEIIHNKYSKADYWIIVGNLYKDLGFITEALSCYQNAKVETKAVNAYNLTGDLLRREGYLELAEQEFQTALELPNLSEEDDLDLRYNLALTYQMRGKTQLAMNVFQEIYAVNIRYKDVGERLSQLNE